MAVGTPVTKTDIDTTSSQLARRLQDWAESVTKFQFYLSGATETDLVALGYTPDDVALLKSAVGDMDKLTKVYRGEAEQTPAYDFRTFILRLGGLNV